jgi:hypothetical protein
MRKGTARGVAKEMLLQMMLTEWVLQTTGQWMKQSQRRAGNWRCCCVLCMHLALTLC